jgi:protein SCO1/2
MKPAALALSLLVWGTSPASAGITASELQEVAVSPPADARIPMQSEWRDEQGLPTTLGEALAGRPALLVFADYTCKTLCGPILGFVVDALGKSGLEPGQYRLIVLGIDPKDGPKDAAALKQNRVSSSGVAAATVMLTADQATIRQVAHALGYRFKYDAEHDQFAHPAAVMALTSDGRLTRVLSGLGIDGNDFRLALTEAGEGRIGKFTDRLRLFCYGFDPRAGIYTLTIYRWLSIAALLTVVTLAGGIAWMSVRSRSAS